MPSLRARRDVELDEVLWRALVDEPPPLVELPIIVCGIDGESTFGMIRREALARSADGAFDEALANLAVEPVQCEELTAGGQPVVIVTGSFYAAEKLLDTAFLAQLQQALGADRLVAAAPGRGCLLVSGAAKTPAERAHFAALARARYDSSGGRAISPAVVRRRGRPHHRLRARQRGPARRRSRGHARRHRARRAAPLARQEVSAPRLVLCAALVAGCKPHARGRDEAPAARPPNAAAPAIRRRPPHPPRPRHGPSSPACRAPRRSA